jgi:hypothetical protein
VKAHLIGRKLVETGFLPKSRSLFQSFLRVEEDTSYRVAQADGVELDGDSVFWSLSITILIGNLCERRKHLQKDRISFGVI